MDTEFWAHWTGRGKHSPRERSPLATGCPTGTGTRCTGASSMPGPVLSKLRKLAHLSLSTTHKERRNHSPHFKEEKTKVPGY